MGFPSGTAASLLLVALALAGCNDGGGSDTIVCPDGTTVDLETVPGHDEQGFDPLSACGVSVPPGVVLSSLPATAAAYRSFPIQWALTLGSAEHAHSMETSVRVSRASVPEDQLGLPETFGAEAAKREHVNHPAVFDARLNFTQPGTWYVRAHAWTDGVHLWTPESVVEVAPVTANGNVVEVAHSPGAGLGTFGPDQPGLKLGDSIRFVNDDLLPHTFTFTSSPVPMAPVELGQLSQGEPVLLPVPGRYVVETDDTPALSVELVV